MHWWNWVFLGLDVVLIVDAGRAIERAMDRDAPARTLVSRWLMFAWWLLLFLVLVYCFTVVA